MSAIVGGILAALWTSETGVTVAVGLITALCQKAFGKKIGGIVGGIVGKKIVPSGAQQMGATVSGPVTEHLPDAVTKGLMDQLPGLIAGLVKAEVAKAVRNDEVKL